MVVRRSGATSTTGLRTATSRSEGENGPCSALDKCEVFRNSPRSTLRSTTTSITRETSNAEPDSRTYDPPPFSNGGNFSLPNHRAQIGCWRLVRISLTPPPLLSNQTQTSIGSYPQVLRPRCPPSNRSNPPSNCTITPSQHTLPHQGLTVCSLPPSKRSLAERLKAP